MRNTLFQIRRTIGKHKTKLVMISLLAAVFTCGVMVGLHMREETKPGEVPGEVSIEHPSEVRVLPTEYLIWISGKAKDFTWLGDPPFFRFFIFTEADPPESYMILGCDNRVTFMDNVISPHFSDITIDWEAEPWVKVFGRGRVVGTVTAYSVDVDVAGQLQNWYYKSFLTRDERRSLWVLSDYRKKPVWIDGSLTEDDLVGLLTISGWERFPVPDNALGKEALVNGLFHGLGGVGLEVRALYVKEETYIRIFP